MRVWKKLAVAAVAAGGLVMGVPAPASATSMVSCFGEEGAQAVKINAHHIFCYAGSGSLDVEIYITWRIESRNNRVRIDYVSDNGTGTPGVIYLDKYESWGDPIPQTLIKVERITIY
ncbi:hypothetical protein GCM10010106_16670 [Thermopolyspora flexuosa]|uniref:Beta/gamma crystallin n=1 Tax=Thermopolyspora flexuosa TaxID=103836 RepID=A0A543J4J4_9ACTN|nr:hypothetical protein [Thermopolyspora flexuosa]TQM77743.1 hypothetical protein FHX40_4514 [Thermopolyspora flexuosa]GGM71022.1 hypothetical protein GCM10010106_16670 [Thermopolyspora flexuosa]